MSNSLDKKINRLKLFMKTTSDAKFLKVSVNSAANRNFAYNSVVPQLLLHLQ